MKARTNQSWNKFSTLLAKIVLGVTTVSFLIAASVTTGRSVSSQPAIQDGNQAQSTLLRKIKESDNLPITVDNSEQSPLFIQSASSKEIEGATFQQLTGGKVEASKYSLHPDVTVVNNASLAVNSFAVCLESKLTDERNCLRFQKVSIAPGTQFLVTTKAWAGPRRGMLQEKFVQKEGKFVKDSRPLDLDSEAMWLPGSIADYRVVILSVVIEDGTKWVTKR